MKEVKENKIQQFFWPELPAIAEWEETFNLVHQWTQIVGKIRLHYMPWINHCWQTTLYVSTCGLTTSLIPHPSKGGFEIEFNFIDHLLEIKTVGGQNISFDLKQLSIADFYHKTMETLAEMGIKPVIHLKPNEIPGPVLPFPENTKQVAYDQKNVHLFWRSLVNVHRVFTRFRAGFSGKASPVHFYWGSFDLAVTRFSGRPAPKHPGGAPNCPDWVMEEAYNSELSSAGFWPGAGLGEPAFYSYGYSEPDGFQTFNIEPKEAYYHNGFREFILPYKAVQSAANPDQTLIDFLQSTYEAASVCGNWDKDSLEMNNEYPPVT